MYWSGHYYDDALVISRQLKLKLCSQFVVLIHKRSWVFAVNVINVPLLRYLWVPNVNVIQRFPSSMLASICYQSTSTLSFNDVKYMLSIHFNVSLLLVSIYALTLVMYLGALRSSSQRQYCRLIFKLCRYPGGSLALVILITAAVPHPQVVLVPRWFSCPSRSYARYVPILTNWCILV